MEVPGMQSAVQFCSTPIAARHVQWLKILRVWVYVFVISLTFTLSCSDLHSVGPREAAHLQCVLRPSDYRLPLL